MRALLAWIVAAFPPPRHTLTDAARALGATTPEQARAVARSIHRAALRTGFDLPTYPAGCARGSVAWKRAMATRGATTRSRARKRTPAEMDAALAAHEADRAAHEAAVAAARALAAEARARREEERAKRIEEGRALAEQRRLRREERARERERRKARREEREREREHRRACREKALRAWRRARPSLPAVVARGTVEQRVASIAARIRAEKALAQWKARRPAEP